VKQTAQFGDKIHGNTRKENSVYGGQSHVPWFCKFCHLLINNAKHTLKQNCATLGQTITTEAFIHKLKNTPNQGKRLHSI